MVGKTDVIGLMQLRMRCEVRLRLVPGWFTVCLLVGGVLSSPVVAMYECVDSSGASVFTDIPSSVEKCTVVTGDSPSPLLPDPEPRQRPVPPRPNKAAALAPGKATTPAPAVPTPPTSPSPPAGDSPGPVAQPEPPAESPAAGDMKVPVFRAGRSLLVHVRLNDARDVRLIVDTGADLTILSSSVANELGLVSSAEGRRVTLTTAGGSVQADLIRVPRVSVGSAEVTNMTAAVHDLPDAPGGADGLLGLSFLEKFLVTLDAQKGELSLRSRP